MSIQSALKTIRLLVRASSEESVFIKDEFGNRMKVPIRLGAIRDLCRPPVIYSGPIEKREWSQEEIEEFYKTNPMLEI